jgi:hypothetical protein
VECEAGNIRSRRVLILYAGSEEDRFTLRQALESRGYEVDTFDELFGASQNLADDFVWNKLEAEISAGKYFFVFSGFPCKSSSICRHNPKRLPGPGPLRALEPARHLWGLPGLVGKDKELVRLGNLHALRTARALDIQRSLGLAAACENPQPWKGLPSLFFLEPLADLLTQGFKDVDFDQCPLGADSRKPTRIRYLGGTFHELQGYTCHHEAQRWKLGEGKTAWAPHKPLAGVKTSSGKWASSAAEAYPDRLNQELALHIDNAWSEITGEIKARGQSTPNGVVGN